MANQQPEETVIAPPKVPQVYQIGNSLHLDWDELDLSMRFFKFHDQANGLTSEVWVKKTSNNAMYDSSRYTLTSVESKRKLAKLLSERFELLDIDWLGLTIQAFTMVVTAYRVGEPTVGLKATNTLKPLEYLIYPLLPKNVPITFVGDGGCGKSTIAVFLCTLLLSAYNDEHNDLGLKMPDEPINCLYLDWETDKDEIEHNLTRFKNGLGIDQDITLHYRRCWQPMGDDMDEIQQQVLKLKPNLIVIDNMASATQTDLIGADAATKLFTRDIRQLHCTTLLLAHHSKNKADEISPLGSIMFKNYSRAVFSIKRDKESEMNRMRIGMYCQKFNRSFLHKPLGFEFTYTEDAITAHKISISESSDLTSNLSMHERIKNMLSRKPQTSLELANLFKLSEPTIKKLLNDHSDMFLVLGEGKWGVKSNMPSEVYR